MQFIFMILSIKILRLVCPLRESRYLDIYKPSAVNIDEFMQPVNLAWVKVNIIHVMSRILHRLMCVKM